MFSSIERRHLRHAVIGFLVVACGGVATESPGGGGTDSGRPAPLVDCESMLAEGTACTQESAHCGGPCSNSWQIENVCTNGVWKSLIVVACGPNASTAPQCRNSFSGGQLSPCCPSGQLYCAGKPDGYPGFGCTPGDGSFCSCTCAGGQPQCGC